MEISQKSLTREQVREVDRLAIERLGIPGIVLMENAALHAAAVVVDQVRQYTGKAIDQVRIAIICGGGNNAGDGYAIARHLHNQGAAVTLYSVKDPDSLTGDAAINAAICRNMGLHIQTVNDAAWIRKAAVA